MAAAAKTARVLRTPAESVEDLVEQQRAQRAKMKELQRRHEAEKEDLRRRQEAEMEGLRGEEAELKRREAEAHVRTDLSPVSIGDLPEPALRRILLGPSDNLGSPRSRARAGQPARGRDFRPRSHALPDNNTCTGSRGIGANRRRSAQRAGARQRRRSSNSSSTDRSTPVE